MTELIHNTTNDEVKANDSISKVTLKKCGKIDNSKMVETTKAKNSVNSVKN